MKLLLLLLFFRFSIFAQNKVSYRIEAKVYNEFLEISEADLEDTNWVLEEDEYGEMLLVNSAKDISINSLPLDLSLDYVDIRIFKTKRGSFKINVEASFGDHDQSAGASTYLIEGVNVIEVSGGDHASGVWSANIKAIVHLKE